MIEYIGHELVDKMKKNISFIFILVMLMGIFFPAINARAFMVDDIEIPEQEQKIENKINIELDNEVKTDCKLQANKDKPEQ